MTNIGFPRAAAVLAAAGLVCGTLAAPASAVLPADVGAVGPTSDPQDPGYWSDQRLAAQLTFVGVDMADLSRARRAAERGVGGITLFGTAPATLARELAAVRSAAAHGVAPFVASDEEGGAVQRLGAAIHPLPSAETMGGWSTGHIRRAARRYGARMRSLGVTMNLGPDADLAVPGHYIASLGRGFSDDPWHVAAAATAWMAGLRAASVTAVVKHWPRPRPRTQHPHRRRRCTAAGDARAS